MKKAKMTTILVLVLGLAFWATERAGATPMGTAWTYQGRLLDANDAADGAYDFEFSLYDDPYTGTRQGSTIEAGEVDVVDGYLSVELDFGSDAFNGDRRWLEIAVRPGDSNDANDFVTLIPRQEVTPTAYALYAATIDWDNLNNVPAGFLDGVDNDTLYTAGEGLLLSDTTFAANTSYLQRRVATSCPVGSFIRAIEANGNVVCGLDNDTLYTAGEGLVLSDTTFAFSTSWGDSRYVNKAGDTMSGSLFVSANVGIGTTNPGAKLDVNGQIKITGGSPGAGKILTSDAGGLASWQTPPAGGDNDWMISGNDMYSIPSGNVGIGTTSPSEKMTVSGNQPAFMLEHDGVLAGVGGGTTSFGVIKARDSQSTGPQAYIDLAREGVSSGVGDLPTAITFGTTADGKNTTAERMRINNTGNVGIGTTSPTAKLTVDGAILRYGSTMYGTRANTHINLGTLSTTGMDLQNYGYATVSGGRYNDANEWEATVSGGGFNTASGNSSTVSGGYGNTASGDESAVGGGYFNTASKYFATISGGRSNTASGDNSVVSGGWSNTASGECSTVSGGLSNEATGDYSFAAGRRAKANHAGTFVWADSSDVDFASTSPDQFLIQASGGVGIGTENPSGRLDVRGGVVKIWDGSASGSWAIGEGDLYVERELEVDGRLFVLDAYNTGVPSGRDLYVSSNGELGFRTSSRRYKENIKPLKDDFSKILRAKPVTFTAKESKEPSLGFIAEDMDELGLSNLVIYDVEGRPESVRYDWIPLYLLELLKDQDELMKDLKAENESLNKRLEALEKSVKQFTQGKEFEL